MAWDLSCRDWEQRLRDGRSLVPQNLPLSTEGDRAVGIFDRLRLADVPGTPTMGDAGGEWFRDIVRVLFGSFDLANRQRMIRELLLLVPKKNSKTTNGALLMLTALLMNFRPRAPFIFVAPVLDTAEIAFNAAAGAIRLDPVLERTLHIRDHLKTIVHRVSQATLRVMTFDPATLTGQKVAGALIDELHVVAKMPRAASAIRQLRGGMLPYSEAFLAFITTQSEEAPVGAFRAELHKARRIRDGKQPGVMLPVLYEFPVDMQRDRARPWRDPQHWHMVTPNLGKGFTLARLVEECEEAERTSEAEMRAWASQHLNVEIGLALHADGWSGAEVWEACTDEAVTLESLLARSEVAAIGIDAGGREDLLSLAVIGRERGTGVWLHWGRSWAQPSVFEHYKGDSERLGDFVEQGDLVRAEPGDDIAQMIIIVERVRDTGLLHRWEPGHKPIGVDVQGVQQVTAALNGAGFTVEDHIAGIPQGWGLTGTINTVDRMLAEGKIVHGGRPIMAWALGNAKVEPKGNAIVITKQAAGRAKIDPLMALFDAAYLMARNPSAVETEITGEAIVIE